jgi:1-pyrroline-5-carboxylate dehydrogenase
MEVLREAGMPEGVINLVYARGSTASDVVMRHPDFAGLHFTGSTETFRNLWKMAADNLHLYHSFPRLVGETGGKNPVVVHASAHPRQVATALTRGAFEYQGQKCSAASRAYIPESLWKVTRDLLLEDVARIKVGSPEDFTNFMTAVIEQATFDKIKGHIERAKASPAVEVVAGGGCDDSTGYFIEPTILRTTDPQHPVMCEEIFGPVLAVYVYRDEQFEKILELADRTSPYALTASIFAKDRYAIALAERKLSNAAGNFFINDKPTGGTPGLQPFGGARASGTNDKVGCMINLMRWCSPRTIKEVFVPPEDFRYPFMMEP